MAHPSLNKLPLEWIRAFETAGRTGSFTAASEELGLTQAAVSQRITNLERQIGTRLFVRKPRGVALSVEGEAWLPNVTNALNELEQSFQWLFGDERDTITISASATMIELWFAPRMHLWIGSRVPQISFSTMVLQADDHLPDTTVKIRYGLGDWPDHYKVELFREAISPVVSPKLLSSNTPWQNLPKIALSGPRDGWQEWMRMTGDKPMPAARIRFDSFSSALAASVAGAGVLLGSLPLCNHLLEPPILSRVTDHTMYPKKTYWMIARKDSITKRQWEMLVERFAVQ
ncbi:MAG: LysR family transcriptional regulator [Rhizobiaceae bacterium]